MSRVGIALDPATARALRAAKALAKAEAAAQAAREERAAAVRDLVAAGWSLAQVAEGLGVSKSRVAQLAK